MIQFLKALPLLAAFIAAPAFAAQPDPHHPDSQPSEAVAAPAPPSAKADAAHGCPMAEGHMMAGGHMMASGHMMEGQGHMSGAAGQHMAGGQMMGGTGGVHCQPAQTPAKSVKRHARHPHHHGAPMPPK